MGLNLIAAVLVISYLIVFTAGVFVLLTSDDVGGDDE